MKFCCFICEWDSQARDRNYHVKQWALWGEKILGQKTVAHWALVNKMKIYLPPLHIKLWLMKISTKGMNQEGEGFKYLRQKFSSVREAKIKEGIFVSQVKQQFQNLTSKINWKLLREELGIHLKTYAATFWEIKIRKLHRNNGANFLIPCLGVQHIIETPFHAIPLGFSPGKYWSRLWQAWSKVPSGYILNG